MSEENKTQETQVADVEQQEVTQDEAVETTNEENQQNQVEQTTEDNHKQALRELSKTLKVNLFDKQETEQFIESLANKVDKSEIEKYESELAKAKELTTKYQDVSLENALLKNNVDDQHQERAKKLIRAELSDGKEMDEAVKSVLDDFPMFQSKTRRVGIDVNDEGTQKTEYERYIEERYEKGKDGKLYPKKR